jgi:hypothetical protein
LREGRPSLADLTGYPETLATKFNGLWACTWFGALHSRRELAPTPSAADFAGPLAREIVRQDATSAYGHGGFNPILDPRCRIIPLSEATLMATQRRFVRQRFASHAAFSRIRSRFRNPVISSLSTAFPYAKGPRAKNSPALHEGIVRSGQEIGRRIGYHQVTEFDASAPSRRRSRACLALTSRRGTDVRTGRPYPPKGGRTFSRCARDRVERPAPPPSKISYFRISSFLCSRYDSPSLRRAPFCQARFRRRARGLRR